jgi:hypothetical protein
MINKNQYAFLNPKVSKLKNKRELLSQIRDTCRRATANIRQNNGVLQTFPLA